MKRLWQHLREAREFAKGKLLDLGCGNAPYRVWFEPKVTTYITADHPPVSSAAMVACDSLHLPFADCSFDTVLCTQVLEHTPKPWIVAQEIHRVARPGGTLILSCPQYWPVHEEPHDYFRFTVYGLRVLFPERDWEWLRHRQQGASWAVIGSSLWLSFRKFGRGKKLLSLLANPIFLALDALVQKSDDTTNHLIVLRRRLSPGQP